MTEKKQDEAPENTKAPETIKMRAQSLWLELGFKYGFKKRGRQNAKTKD